MSVGSALASRVVHVTRHVRQLCHHVCLPLTARVALYRGNGQHLWVVAMHSHEHCQSANHMAWTAG